MDLLLDTSWTLHYLSTSSASYRNLFSNATAQEHLSRYFDRLPQFLSNQEPRYVDDLKNDSEKLGLFRDCQPSVHQFISDLRLIQLKLNYQHATFTFILYSPYLILSKAPASHTKHITTFLSETFIVSIDPLKLPSNLLANTLQNYLSVLVADFVQEDNEDDGGYEHLRPEHRAALLSSAIGTLKITISFSGPVAPNLKTVDISVPYDTVDTLHTKATTNNKVFFQYLADQVHLQTGLKLPLTGEDEHRDNINPSASERAESVASTTSASSSKGAPLKLSKLTTAAFAISTDGRLRFAGKAIEKAIIRESMVIEANMGLLAEIVEEAKKRAETRGVD